MYRQYMEHEEILNELHAAEAELEALREQIQAFESVVDSHLGDQLDQINDLNCEIASLNDTLLRIRDQHLFGEDRMRYLNGAPINLPPPLTEEVSPSGVPLGKVGLAGAKVPEQDVKSGVPDIKNLYRKLARRYHPDLARTEGDRFSLNEQMTQINQLYSQGDLASMMRLAGLVVPSDLDSGWQSTSKKKPGYENLSDAEKARERLKSVEQEIARLSNLPSVRLSLEVKLARHQGRDLLGEMAMDLRYKVARKMAERDYLKAQINTSQGWNPGRE